AVADRAAVEQDFHDVKEVRGAGQQQLRNYWASLAASHLTLWLHTLVELWAWQHEQGSLCDRRPSPWDDPSRRPSHADRCKALRGHCLESAIRDVLGPGRALPKIRPFVQRLVTFVPLCYVLSE